MSYLVRVAVRPAGGHWQTPETLSRSGLSPGVAVGAQDEAIVAWEASGNVEETERPAGGNWLRPKAVLTPGGEEPQVATDAKGDVLIASTDGLSRGIEVTQRFAGGAFSESRVISGNENAHNPRVAMNARGDALVAWVLETDQRCWVRAASYVAGGGWSSPRTISSACGEDDPQVAIDEAGDATVVWSTARRRSESLEEATMSADGRWRAQKLHTYAGELYSSQLGMDARGDTIVAWSQHSWKGPLKDEEWVRVRPAGKRWLPAQMLASPRALSSASLAVSARGDALLAWGQLGRMAATTKNSRRMVAATMVAATKSSTDNRWRLSTIAKTDDDPIAEIAPNGYGVVAWMNHKGINTAWSISPVG